ncbi:hypothetical protein N7G274_009731 [Stereocaulon virgatum]|uniref:Brl1/Brr6 domain-containing protein n=1 Tax=Stereocaulon virgatum TaxID=373712 RepID=A0ABR3ZWX3_9LECA
MAAERSSANPTIVEPATSSNSPNPPNLPIAPSSSSSESNRLQSQCSNVTSQSEPSDSSTELQHVPETAAPTSRTVLASLSQSSTHIPPSTASISPMTYHDHIQWSVQQGPTHNTKKSSWFHRLSRPIPYNLSRYWLLDILGMTIAIISLAASLASLIWLGVRTYKLSVSSAINDAVSACASLIQASLATPETISPKCQGVLAQGPITSPYQLDKRTLHGFSPIRFFKLLERYQQNNTCLLPVDGCQERSTSPFHMYFKAVLICASVILGALLLMYARQSARVEDVFQSAARSNVQVTRHHGEGIETTTNQTVRIVKQNPKDDQNAGQLRQRIRNLQNQDSEDCEDDAAWQPYNSSTDTLVNPWTGPNPSKVSITNSSHHEEHEGLVELETTGDNKTFFDSDTGEFVHIKPWKSTHNEDEESDDDRSLKADDKGSTKSALARMATGGAAWGGGNDVDEALKARISEVDKEIKRMRIPHRAGDCLAGLVTNERSSGWPQTI